MKVAFKVWLDNHGKAFGDGPYQLLRGVQKTKSLHQASLRMGMSYSKAWRLIRILEERLGIPLLERKRGGLSGGGSEVTPEAKRFLEQYSQFHKEVEKALEIIYQRYFDPSLNFPPLFRKVRGKKD